MQAATILGAIIAGGASRRFGSDKAEALWRGRALIDHAADALRPQVGALVVCGRTVARLTCLADRPEGVGPLGGLAAALHHCAERGHLGVLCMPVDVHPLPLDLRARLAGKAPAVFARQHMIGWWPAALAGDLDAFIAAGGRSLAGWIEASAARRVADPDDLVNVNRQADLPRLPS